MSDSKMYEPFAIPNRNVRGKNESVFASSKKGTSVDIYFDEQPFAEVEIDSSIKTSYKPAPIPKQEETVMDEKRILFNSMRDISRYNHSSYFLNSNFYHKQAQYENSKIFYKQAVFMKDFQDDYAEPVPFSSYFPYYQQMSYEQLRTYFTWRTKVRNGNIENTSLSYAFVYVYELLNQIGVTDPACGLDKLLLFWNTFKIYDATIEKYLIKWVKDYHIYYELPWSFKEFVILNGLQHHYPDIVGYNPELKCGFEQLCGISKYAIKQSAFYNEETSGLISECFDFVIGKLQNTFADAGIELKDLIFQSSKSKSIWEPFNGALFYSIAKLPNRRIVLSDNEIYTCCQNKWLISTVIPIDSGRQLIGYIFKQMEAVLRSVTKYKYKLTASPNMVGEELLKRLDTAGVSLEKTVTDAVLEFNREKNKIVVSVNPTALNRIRTEALDTQEKLIVPENDFQIQADSSPDIPLAEKDNNALLPPVENQPFSDGWTSLRNALSEIEIQALAIALQDNGDIKQFADKNGIMLEVLADGINEKAFDGIGDNLLELDDTIMIYEEYKEKIKIMVR